MDKELQDLAWSCLPKEFKEEVKYEYRRVATKVIKSNYDLGFMNALEGMYGHHNLNSDAEGEEMLCVPRKDIVELYREVQKTISQCKGTELATQAIGIRSVIWSFLGSKCMPDQEAVAENATTTQKPAEPKYHKGEKVYYNGYVYEIEGYVGKNRYALKGLNFDLDEDMIEPYIKPEENIAGNRNLSQDCDKEFDNILKNSFSKERRLNVAAMAMQGILSNESRMKQYEAMAASKPYEKLTDVVARNALRYADAIMNQAGE